ncbi:hypothetical protein TeGR_g15228, partial [Tetraparma gracilis]
MEPYRETWFVATTSPSEVETQLKYNSAFFDREYRELKALIDRGGSNQAQLEPQITAAKSGFKECRAAEKNPNPSLSYTWTIDGVKYDGFQVGPIRVDRARSSVTVVLEQHLLTKTEYELLSSVEVEVPLQYVRRAMGELSGSDRRNFFSAVKKMYDVPSEVGKEEYGEFFVGMQ